jgi:hypothetical protein
MPFRLPSDKWIAELPRRLNNSPSFGSSAKD